MKQFVLTVNQVFFQIFVAFPENLNFTMSIAESWNQMNDSEMSEMFTYYVLILCYPQKF